MQMIKTVEIGQRAESAAAEYLVAHGYGIMHRNWRRPDYEIDIVAQKEGVVYFVEVKYRATDRAGSGLEYITGAKLKQMAYAARRWTNACRWRGDYALAAIEVSGEAYEVTAFVESIDW